eukprot:6044688-Amphidinium_carterae.1
MGVLCLECLGVVFAIWHMCGELPPVYDISGGSNAKQQHVCTVSFNFCTRRYALKRRLIKDNLTEDLSNSISVGHVPLMRAADGVAGLGNLKPYPQDTSDMEAIDVKTSEGGALGSGLLEKERR